MGDIIEYKVKSLFANYCELIDERTDITSYLQGTAKLVLFKGQTVKCRVLAVSEKHPKIELVDISAFEQSNDNLTETKLVELLETREISWNTKDFVKLLLTEEKEKSFESQCHRWIRSLLNKKIDLQTVMQDCSDLLELSDLLNICSYNERDYYQERLTLIVEQLSYYNRASELLENEASGATDDTPALFIDSLFSKLKVSGFVYHPVKNFNILSSLFLRRPELMNSRIRELLDIMSEKDIQIWEREPFCSALIKLLELYIRESDGRVDKIKNNKELIDNNVLALAIQLLLVKGAKVPTIADYRLNAARLSLLSSYLYPSSIERFVNVACYLLFNSKAKLPVYTVEGIKALPRYIFSMPCGNIDTVNSFSHGNGRLLISSKGICLQSGSDEGTLRPVFPKELDFWQNLQVFLPYKTETSLTSVKPNDIAPYQSVWSEIEMEFFNVKKKPVVVAAKNKKRHRIDDIVRISFIRQDVNDRAKFYCQVEDEIGGNGYIFVSDIVPYSVSPSLRYFYAFDGSRYVFNAKIIDKEDDMFHFSMLDDLQEYYSDFYSFDQDIICSVGGAPNPYGMAPAVTTDGVSVSIENASDFEDIRKASIVLCRLKGAGRGKFHIRCEMVDYENFDFDLGTAFKNLMENSRVDVIHETITKNEEEQILESDKLLDESYVKEVIYMIDRMAMIDNEYVKSFNYLGFARIMCLLIGWESQAAYYKGRMDIIAMLHDFAQNSKLDEAKLEQLENANAELFSNNVVLRDWFHRLQTVSFLGKNDHNAELFELSNSDASLKKLASLVLAYNITKTNGLESSATDIHNKIIQLLNLRGYETGLKQYGDGEETEVSEYKTSFIYYAEAGSSLPNPEKQKEEILRVIDSFFNTRGGTLYIGVNNFGYGVGVADDLRSPLYFGDKDKYILSVVDAVALEWGNNIATTYIRKIGFDETNTDKDVLVIEILPIQSGLPYKDVWYVRKAGSKRKLTAQEFAEYQAVSRKLQAVPLTAEQEVALEIPSELKPETVEAKEQISVSKPLVTSKDDKIKTSRIRKNVLVEWEDNYVEPIAFFKFLSGGKFKKLDAYDFDDNSLLTLVVKESEKKGYLVMGYENGHIVKAPVEEILEYNNREYIRNTDSKLLFATIAGEDDAILTIAKENKTRPKTLMRLDHLSNFDEGRLPEGGQTPYNEGLASEILAYDVIPADAAKDFSLILDKPRTSLGNSKSSPTQSMINKLHLWGIEEI